jgi:predicted porin
VHSVLKQLEILIMKKSLLALAVLAATAAQAQSSVTLYGIADVAYNNSTVTSFAGVKTQTNDFITNGLSASRLGFKGERDIASGLKANFVMEFEVDPSTETQVIKTRIGTVGLGGEWGGVSLGRRNTLIKDVEYAFDVNMDPTAAGYLGNYARDSRRDDLLTYSTPKFAGFSADVQIGLGSTPKETSAVGVVSSSNDGKKGDSQSVGLNYVNGPLAIKFGTETVKSTVKDIKVAGYSVAKATAVEDFKNDALGASYDLGMAKLFFVNTKSKQGTEATKVTFDSNNLGVRVPMGAFTFNANVSEGKAKFTNSTTKADMSGVQLSVWYALNKETTIYGIYGQEKIKHVTLTTTPEQKSMLIGMRYTF